MLKKICVGVVCSLIVATGSWAGVVITVESKDLDRKDAAAQIGRIAIDGSKMTVNMEGQGEAPQMIFRGDRELMWALNPSTREYTEIDKEMLASLGSQMSEAMKMMEQQLANMPAEQRAMVEKMMKERMPQMAPASPDVAEVTVKKTGEKSDVAGYPCVKYEIHRGSEKIREIWATDWSHVELGRESFEIFSEVEEFMGGLLDAMKDSPWGGMAENPFDQFSKIDGFPVLTREYTGGRATKESLFKSIEQQDLATATFEPPTGYKKK